MVFIGINLLILNSVDVFFNATWAVMGINR